MGTKPTTRPCHRPGCPNVKRHGRAYHYCSDACAREVALGVKRTKSRQWREGRQATFREQRLWTIHRMTLEEFDAKLAEQGGRCAICRADRPGGSGTWHIDHDHSCCPTKKTCGECIRGLLCYRCNRLVLGVLEGPLLQPGLAYLEKHRRVEV